MLPNFHRLLLSIHWQEKPVLVSQNRVLWSILICLFFWGGRGGVYLVVIVVLVCPTSIVIFFKKKKSEKNSFNF